MAREALINADELGMGISKMSLTLWMPSSGSEKHSEYVTVMLKSPVVFNEL